MQDVHRTRTRPWLSRISVLMRPDSWREERRGTESIVAFRFGFAASGSHNRVAGTDNQRITRGFSRTVPWLSDHGACLRHQGIAVLDVFVMMDRRGVRAVRDSATEKVADAAPTHIQIEQNTSVANCEAPQMALRQLEVVRLVPVHDLRCAPDGGVRVRVTSIPFRARCRDARQVLQRQSRDHSGKPSSLNEYQAIRVITRDMQRLHPLESGKMQRLCPQEVAVSICVLTTRILTSALTGRAYPPKHSFHHQIALGQMISTFVHAFSDYVPFAVRRGSGLKYVSMPCAAASAYSNALGSSGD